MAKKNSGKIRTGMPTGARRKEVDLAQLELYAQKGLSIKEICACLGMSTETFYQRLNEPDSKIRETVEKARATLVALAAETIIQSAVTHKDPRSALEILRRHGDRWKDTPLVEVTAGTATISSEAVNALGEETINRMFRAWGKAHPEALQ